MARKHSKAGKKRTLKQRQRKYKGGGWGFTGASSIPGAPGTVSNPQVFTGIGDCRATEPSYTIPTSQYGASMKGLPGMSGGKRTRKGRKGSKTRKHRQRGGRYGFFPEGDVNPSGQAWWAGSYAPIQRIACEGTTQNPLNPTHTGSSAPPGAASPNYYMTPGKGLMSGGSMAASSQRGGAQLAPATYGVGNVDSMYHYSPTAGYANTASTWKDSVGAPVQIQVPFAARSMNQACLSTGGHPPLTGALQAGGKRKGKKGSGRRSRKQRGGEATLFGFTLPTKGDNFKRMGSNFASRFGLSGLFGTGAPATNATNATNAANAAIGNAYVATNVAENAMPMSITPPPVSNAPMANAPMANAPMANAPINLNRNMNRNRNNRQNLVVNAEASVEAPPMAANGNGMNMGLGVEQEETFGPSTMGGRSRRRKSRKSSHKKKRSGR